MLIDFARLNKNPWDMEEAVAARSETNPMDSCGGSSERNPLLIAMKVGAPGCSFKCSIP